IIVALACAFVFTAWSLLLGIPLILLSVILLVDPLRFGLITKPAYKTLANSMPSISTTELEALEAGTSWWEKELFRGAPDWNTFNAYAFP
ncbi:acyl-CoA dehydrogenase, partial [Escherichia coli]|nr:acyl-CoA dehydrogenase [Escherichia coli]